MMPNNIHLLLRHAYQNNDKDAINLVNNTLVKMAFGGVYDQIGGGFARYSTDDKPGEFYVFMKRTRKITKI